MRMNQLSGGQVFRHFHDYMKCGEDSCGICAAIRTCILSIFSPLPKKESIFIPEEGEMSDKRIKELLILWDDLVHCFLPIGTDAMLKEKLIEIRRRIEHGPEVSRKKISQLLAQRPSWDTEICIIQYLRERGVTVEEGK